MKTAHSGSIILIAIAIVGCNDGEQRGRFAVSGHSSRSLSGVVGELSILRGDPLPLTPSSNGSTPLLYVLTVAPGATASGSNSTDADETYVSILKQTWSDAQGLTTAAVELTWDRRADTVCAGGTTFDRTKGNAFVLTCGPSGAVTATQVGTLVGTPTDAAALQQMQVPLPPGSPANGVTLVVP